MVPSSHWAETLGEVGSAGGDEDVTSDGIHRFVSVSNVLCRNGILARCALRDSVGSHMCGDDGDIVQGGSRVHPDERRNGQASCEVSGESCTCVVRPSSNVRGLCSGSARSRESSEACPGKTGGGGLMTEWGGVEAAGPGADAKAQG